MGKYLLRNGLVVVVVLLFIEMCIVSSTTVTELKDVSTVSFDGDTLYVGGGGPGNYSHIQDAVDAADSGDTVYVYAGFYFESVVIDKSLSVIGENRETTIIDKQDIIDENAITVYSDEVSITGFTVRDAGGSYSGIVIISSYNSISDCNILGNGEAGIIAVGVENSVTNCYFSGNQWGLELLGGDESTERNTVTDCTFIGDNIHLFNAQYNIFDNCTLDEGWGLHVDSGDSNIIRNCIFNSIKGPAAIKLESNDDLVENCIITNADGEGIRIVDGQGTKIINCFVANNNHGIGFWGSSINNEILDCDIRNNELAGVYFFGGLRNIHIFDCNIVGNEIGIEFVSSNFFNFFLRNNFNNSNDINILSFFMFNIFNNNYWSDYSGSGPYHVYGLLNWDVSPASSPYPFDYGV